MFHIAPDDTGASAVWVAQRLKDDEFAVVANKFVIRQVDLSNEEYFLGSPNLEESARRGGLQVHGSIADGTFDFTATYSTDRGFMSPYANRRVWRLFDLVAPKLQLPADTNANADDYPFAVVPERLLSAADLMLFMRDHYEGTPYDMTKGLAAGPGGDPSRFDAGANSDGVTGAMTKEGKFERAISLFRSSYSFVVVCRASLPDQVGSMVWVGYYAPHASVYVPFYPASASTPDSFNHGSLFRLDRSTAYWGHAAAGNYADRFYIHTIKEFQAVQDDLENKFMERQAEVEAQVVDALKHEPQQQQQAVQLLTDFTESCAKATHSRVWQLLDQLIEKYHDGYEVTQQHAEKFVPAKLFYPLEWLQGVGYFQPGSQYALAQTSGGEGAAQHGGGGGVWTGLLGALVGICAGALMGTSYQRSKYASYTPLN